ncbi:MAG: hypothetical protein HC867_05015 [Bacteroidia bacterium]|nr:hypothetical protein [Bacteroidia bacterium]
MVTLFISAILFLVTLLLIVSLRYLKHQKARETVFFLKDNSRLLNEIRFLL